MEHGIDSYTWTPNCLCKIIWFSVANKSRDFVPTKWCQFRTAWLSSLYQAFIQALGQVWLFFFWGLSLSHTKNGSADFDLGLIPLYPHYSWWDIPLYHYIPWFNNCYTIIPLLSHYPIIPCFSPNLLGQITLDQARLMDLRRLRIGAAHLAKTSPVKP